MKLLNYFFFSVCVCGGGGGGGGGGGRVVLLKPKQYARLSNEVKYKKSNHLYNIEHLKKC